MQETLLMYVPSPNTKVWSATRTITSIHIDVNVL